MMLLTAAASLSVSPLAAQEWWHPRALYIFPAGAQRGTTVQTKIGGQYLYESAHFSMVGRGVTAPESIEETNTVWFEGPMLRKPLSNKGDDYPTDYAAEIKLDADAPLGLQHWRVWTSQGVTPAKVFVVGDLPEVIEEEIEGIPIPTPVELPVTINGRIFPREDVDVWTFEAEVGSSYELDLRARTLGSPLDARLILYDPTGRRVDEDIGSTDTDPRIQFTAETSGTYRARVDDIKSSGLQAYVYRLSISKSKHVDWLYPLGGRRGDQVQFQVGTGESTETFVAKLPEAGPRDHRQRFRRGESVTNEMLLRVGNDPEYIEKETDEIHLTSGAAAAPSVLNGRISEPGDIDTWAFQATKGKKLHLGVEAVRLGSPLDSVLVVTDSDGKELGRADDVGGETDANLQFDPPADGVYRVQISERFRSRGRPEFAYRLTISPPTTPDLSLTLGTDGVRLYRGAKTNVAVSAVRQGGVDADIELHVDGLPTGVTATNLLIPAGKTSGQITLEADETAAIRGSLLRITGSITDNGYRLVRSAERPTPRGERGLDTVLLCVALKTPFEVTGAGLYYKRGPRGGTIDHPFVIKRKGYNGELTIKLAEKQRRHLQGITGESMVVPAEADEFTMRFYLSPRMETARTSRTLVVAIGTIVEPDGTKHRVGYTNNEATQMVLNINAGRLSLQLNRGSITLGPNQEQRVTATVVRGRGLEASVSLELVPPRHMAGVSGKPVVIPADRNSAEFVIKSAETAGPFNAPLTLRATAHEGDHIVVGETALDVVWSPTAVAAVADASAQKNDGADQTPQDSGSAGK